MVTPTRTTTSKPFSWATLFRDLIASRELVVTFAQRDLRVRYKQTVLGVGWAVVQPLVFLVVFVVFFGRVAGFDEDTDSYAAFALSALVAWQFLASIVAGASFALVSESAVLRKVYFSRLAPIVGRVLSSGPQILVGIALMLVLAPVLGGKITLQLLWLPLLIALLALPALAIVIPTSALSIWFRDISVLVPFFLQVWLFASPVAYPLSSVNTNERLYAFLNPAAGPIDGFRRIYVEGVAPDFSLLIWGVASSLIIAVIGIEVFRRLEPGFADVI